MGKPDGRFVDKETKKEVGDPLQLEEAYEEAANDFWDAYEKYRVGKLDKVSLFRRYLKYLQLSTEYRLALQPERWEWQE